MTPTALLELRLREARACEEAHYRRFNWLSKWNTALTVAVVIASTVVGSALFALLNQNAGHGWKLALALASLVAAVLAGLQKGLNLAKEAEQNRVAGAGWAKIFNHVAEALTYVADDQLRAALKDVTGMVDGVVGSSPRIPQRLFKRVQLNKIYKELEDAA